MNSKADKVALLKDISAGLVNPADIPADPVIISEREEMFYGVMMADTQIIFVGEAKKALNEFMQSIDIDQKAI
jgi:hypothetical protein